MGLDLNKESQLKNYSLEYLRLNVKVLQNQENKVIHLLLGMIPLCITLKIQNIKNIGTVR